MRTHEIRFETSPARRDLYIGDELVRSIRYNRAAGWIMYDPQDEPLYSGTLDKLTQRAIKDAGRFAALQPAIDVRLANDAQIRHELTLEA